MKSFCKYFILTAGLLVTLLAVIIQCSWVQKICLQALLSSQFDQVNLINFKGGSKQIKVDKIEAKNKLQSITLSHFQLDWEPWYLIFKRELHVKNLQFHCFMRTARKLKRISSYAAGLGKFLNNSDKEAYHFLRKLQLPVKLHLDKADIHFQGNFPGIDIVHAHIVLETFISGQMSVGHYLTLIDVPIETSTIRLQTQGDLQFQLDKKNFFQAIRLKGNVQLKNGNQSFPELTYIGSISKKPFSDKEKLKFELHWGQANDFLLTGETFKTADYWVDFKWQAICDHSLFQLLNIKKVPTLSILLEGDCGLHRKKNTWNLTNSLSVWAKDFSTTLSLPTLNLRAKIDTEIGDNHIRLKQYMLRIKEKGTKNLFFSIDSLQPLTYVYKKGFQYNSNIDKKILEIKCYEIPFGILNPYLRAYGCCLQGQLDNGHVYISRSDKIKQWIINVAQPIHASIQKLDVRDDTLLSDVNIQLNGYCNIKEDLSSLTYRSELIFSDFKGMPFFKIFPSGSYEIHEKRIDFSSAGNLEFNFYWAKNWLNLKPFKWDLHPEFYLKADYNVERKKDIFTLQDLKIHIYSTATEEPWLNVQLLKPFKLKNGMLISTETNPLLKIQAQKLPMNLFQHKNVYIEGDASFDGYISGTKEGFVWISTQPGKISPFKLSYKQNSWLDLDRIVLDETYGHYSSDTWHFMAKDMQMYGHQQDTPLLKLKTSCNGVNGKLETIKGCADVQLNSLCLQPFALNYPNCLGSFNSDWIWGPKDKNIRASIEASLLDVPISLKAEADYTRNAYQFHQLQGHMEFQNQYRVSDISFKNTLNKDNFLNGNVWSNKLFLQDALLLTAGLYKLQQSITKVSESILPTATVSIASGSDTNHFTTQSDALIPFQLPFQGICNIYLRSIADLQAIDVLSTIELEKHRILLKSLKGQLCQGDIQGNAVYNIKNSKTDCNFSAQNIHLQKLWAIPEAFSYSLQPYGKLSGTGACHVQLSCNLPDWEKLNGYILLQAENGSYIPQKTLSTTGQAVSSITTLLGKVTDNIIPGLNAVNFVASYLKSIPFSSLTLEANRLNADKITIKADGINADIGIQINGYIETKPEISFLDQNFFGNLQLKAPEQSSFMNYMDFNKEKTDEKGYHEGPHCKLTGTLGNPNYITLSQLFYRQPKTHSVTPQSNSLQESSLKKEKLQDILFKTFPIKNLLNAF